MLAPSDSLDRAAAFACIVQQLERWRAHDIVSTAQCEGSDIIAPGSHDRLPAFRIAFRPTGLFDCELPLPTGWWVTRVYRRDDPGAESIKWRLRGNHPRPDGMAINVNALW